MYIADCLYKGTEVEITAKSESILNTLLSSIEDIEVLDIVQKEENN